MSRITAALALSTCCIAAPTAWSVPADDFDDNARGPEWSLLEDDPSLVLSEQNARLEVLAANPTSPSTDALYLSNGPAGFTLSTADNFSIAIDYSFASFVSSVDGGALGLVFGVGRDLDGTDSAAVGFGYADIGPAAISALTVAHRTDDVQAADATVPGAPASGTFLITYDAAGDDLSFGRDGSPPVFVLADTVRGVWGASDLLISFGARGNGFATTSGQAFLDNFEVRSGTIVPEPASLSVLIVGAAGLCRRRRRG